MAEARPRVTETRRIAPIWAVPIVAVLLGVYMVIYTYANQGPTITISFETAEGIEAGTTKIKALDVDVGLVQSVELSDDLESVVVTAKLEPSARRLLREDTEFWVVRARVGSGGISGLGTIVSGGYIQVAPGTGPEGRREFEGLEIPPVTPVGTPGLNVTIVSEDASSLGPGDPILYKGYPVGRIESSEFDVDEQRLRYHAFVEEPYDALVTDSTRFWNASGIAFSATAEGIEVETGSLQSLIFGGVSFGLPVGSPPGEPVQDGAEFRLYPSYADVNERPYRHHGEYVVRFDQSIRGLVAGAPVEYRGLPAGRVERILLKETVTEAPSGEGDPIAVLIRLDPGRLELGDSEEGVARLAATIETAVGNGMRATLSTGSLITGSLYVSLDFYRNAKPASVGSFAGRPTIPTIASGLQGLEQKVAALLDKLNAVPLEEVVTSADGTLRKLEVVLGEIETLLASDSFQALPAALEASLSELADVLASVAPDSPLRARLERTIADLDRTLQSVDALARKLEAEPNSLVFPSASPRDPEPPAGTR